MEEGNGRLWHLTAPQAKLDMAEVDEIFAPLNQRQVQVVPAAPIDPLKRARV